MPAPDPLDAAPVRAAGTLVIGGAAVAVVTGGVLAFAYRPGEYGWLRTLHSGSAAVAVISAIAARVVARGGHLRVSGRGVALVAVLVVVVGGAFATGTQLAWKSAAPGDRGMFLSSGHHVLVGGTRVSTAALVTGFVVHTVVGLCSFALLGWDYVRAWCRPRPSDPPRRRRPRAPSNESSGTAATT